MSESEYERRQREMAQRILRNAMPDLSRVFREVTQPYLANIAKLYTQQYQELLASLAQSTLPDIPALKLDYNSLFPNLQAITANALKSMAPGIKLIQDLQRDQFAEIIATARAAWQAGLPPNWRGEDVSIPPNLEALLLDEGLALAWVPPHNIIVRLFGVPTAGARRRIIGDRWRSITRACIGELEAIEDPDLAEHVEFALNAAGTLLANNPRPAQALSANLLDSILRKSFDDGDRQSVTGQKQRLDIDEYPLRVAIVLGGIWGSYGEFWTSKGDAIPREYSRHGSAHGVSRRQYSRINSVLALMHVVSLLKLLETDLARDSKE